MPDGSGAPEASVSLMRGDRWSFVTSCPDGRFEIDNACPPGGTLAAELDGLHASAEIEFFEGGGVSDVRLVLKEAERSAVLLRVADEQRRPIPGARAYGQETDGEGRVTLTFGVPPGTEKDLSVSAPGRITTSVLTLTARSPLATDVILRPAVATTLDVRAQDGSAVENTSATFAYDGGTESAWCLDPDLVYRVRVKAPGFLDYEIREWRPEAVLRATLQPAASIRGCLLEGDAPAWGWASFQGSRVWSNRDGEFLLGGLPDASGVLVAGARENMPGVVIETAVIAGTITDVGPLALAPPVRLTGRVTDERGRPVGGVALDCETSLGTSTHAFSNADGRFRIEAPGFLDLRIVASKRGHGTAEAHVPRGPARDLGDIVLPAATGH